MIAADLVPLAFAVDKLRLLPGNPRRGNVDAVKRSLEAFGQRKPIVVRRSDRVVIAGNHTLQAAQALGWAEVAVVWVDDDDTTSKAFALADNRTAELGDYDEAALADLIGQVGSVDPELLEATGWANDDLRKLLNGLEKSGDEGDGVEIFEMPTEPITKDGDLWIMGGHRLLCGDSFNEEHRSRLLDGAKVNLVATDPPYAIYGSSTGFSGSDIADDKMVRPFFESLSRIIAGVLEPFAHSYMFTDWRTWAALQEGSKRAGLTPKNMLVWDKGGGIGNMYALCYELIAFHTKTPKGKSMTEGIARGQRQVLRPNILRFNRVSGVEREHNAAKPVELMEELIGNSSDAGDVVLDLFGGSGSTLIAAHNLGRLAYLMEMEPKYCDVIVGRWERLTGLKAIRQGG
jgi:DNA modification methylase